MIDAFNTWLKDHPLQDGLIFLALSIVLGKFGVPALVILWKFAKIPPQRFSVWMLKARLSASEAKLRRLRRMGSDFRYLAFHIFSILFMLGLAIGLTVLACTMAIFYEIHTAMHQVIEASSSKHAAVAAFISAYTTYFTVWYFSIELVGIIKRPKASAAKLSAKIERLKKKLGMESNAGLVN